MLHLFQRAFSKKYLLFTNVFISAVLSGTGDVIEQRYEMLMEDIPNWNSIRTRNMAISGITTGIMTHYWYNFLEKYLPGASLRIVTRKVILDQFICSPLTIGAFFVTLAILEESDLDTLQAEITQKGWRLYVAEWVIWPPAQFINFFWLPHKYRVLYDSSISLFYDIYTSYVKNKLPLDQEL